MQDEGAGVPGDDRLVAAPGDLEENGERGEELSRAGASRAPSRPAPRFLFFTPFFCPADHGQWRACTASPPPASTPPLTPLTAVPWRAARAAERARRAGRGKAAPIFSCLALALSLFSPGHPPVSQFWPPPPANPGPPVTGGWSGGRPRRPAVWWAPPRLCRPLAGGRVHAWWWRGRR